MAYTTINKSSDYFNTKIWTGTGANLSITGVGHQPDFTWIKNRANTDDHNLFDVLRGFSTDALLRSNTTGAATDTTDGIKSFDSDGFSLGANGSSNGNGQGMVAWNWKAGGGQGSANTDGSINTTYTSANTTAGFSISKYTGNNTSGATIGHGLGAVPKMIIVKRLDTADQWCVYHQSIGNTKRIKLNSTDATSTGSGYWNNTTPTSSLFTIGNSSEVNGSNGNYIAYCFAEKTGYSKFGSYTGNGSTDGTFVYTGFKPAWVMIKKSSASGTSWEIRDNKRQPFTDGNAKRLFADDSSAESSNNEAIEKLSNGFKIRSTGGGHNTSGATYIYMAFAEAPLVGSNNVPCTAR